MTKTLLLTGLLCCFLNTAFSQHLSDRQALDLILPEQPVAKIQPPHLFRMNPPENLPDHMIGKGHPFTSSDTLLLSEIPGRMVLTPGDCGLNNNMPVVRPRGHFPSIIIKPNESVDYKLIIKKPR